MSARHLHTGEKTLVDQLLAEQQQLTAVERFSEWHDRRHDRSRYSHLMPASPPGPGEQYAFEVNLDACTGCKACVAACHSLNGLDPDEAWRDVGLLLGGHQSDAYQQTVTTACHHCEDPACLNGCPVGAYEKEADTGVVKHLDDQCIGCGYCVLKCSYDVPKYNERLGIVRKCDMCVGRLREGEAPACVQACPTSAISIRIVMRADLSFAPGATILPGAYDASYTRPSTSYVTERSMPANTRAADAFALREEHAHWPLIAMLALTQWSVGMFVVAAVMAIAGISKCTISIYSATALLMAGLGVSVLHLGKPMGAWRFFLGLRKSWMSREILAFSVLAGCASMASIGTFYGIVGTPLTTVTAIVGLVAVFTSAMIYIDTRRPFWNAALTHGKFFGGMMTMGLGSMASMHSSDELLALALAGSVMLFAWEQSRNRRALEDEACPWHLAARVMKIKLGLVASLREGMLPLMVAFATLAFATQSSVCFATVTALTVTATVLERYTFFVASMGLKMPGGYKP